VKSSSASLQGVAVLSVLTLFGAACGARIGPPAALPASQVATGGAASASGDSGTTPQVLPSDTGAANGTGAVSGSTPAAVANPAAVGATRSDAAAASGTSGEAAGPAARQSGAAGPAGSKASSSGVSPGELKAGTSGGSGSGAGGAGPSGTPADSVKIGGPSSQGISDSEIKIGVLAPLSGAAGFLGELELDGVKAYLSDVNARGGVHGRKYRIVSADTRMESPTEATGARRLVEDDKVFGLIATFADSLSPYVASRGIPTATFGMLPRRIRRSIRTCIRWG